MLKLLFFDQRGLEYVRGFTRELGHPTKAAANPLFIADQPWENGNMQLYGSVVKAPGRPFQAWYSIIHRPWRMYLGYAESDDGLVWRKPLLDVFRYQGALTNIVLDRDPHGPAVIYDEREPDPERRYKLLCGADPAGSITAFTSPDGIHWRQVGPHPVITTAPDCPMGLFRADDGRYVAFHRVSGYGRRVFRDESWDFQHWSSEPRLVLEEDWNDSGQTQFYGFGATTYGSFELGTLWHYHTEVDEPGASKMCGYQEAELTYARSGYAIHRAAPGQAFLPHGLGAAWDRGNLQCASQPVFLPDEIRYYYMGTDMRHKVHWELDPQTAGLGLATLCPDGFVALSAGVAPAELLTFCFQAPSPTFAVNAEIAPGGWVRVALLDANRQVLPGFGEDDAPPLAGNGCSLPVRWAGSPAGTEAVLKDRVRIRLRAQQAKVYSVFSVSPGEVPQYHRFQALRP